MPAWKAMQQSIREWTYRAQRAEAERAEWKRRAEAAELSLKLFVADNGDLQDAHRTIGELKAQLAQLQLDYMDTANGVEMERQRAETAEAKLAAVQAKANAWDAIPTGALLDYWDGSNAITPDAHYAIVDLTEWICKLTDLITPDDDPQPCQEIEPRKPHSSSL